MTFSTSVLADSKSKTNENHSNLNDNIKIILSKNSVTLEGKGDTTSIDAIIIENNKILKNPNKKIQFTSSNNEISRLF